MGKGSVKDPTGHQSNGYDFGYIQRIATTKRESIKLKWPDKSEQTKSIPFLNKKKIGGEEPLFKIKDIGQEVDFTSVKAVIYLETDLKGKKIKKRIKLGTIGIALLDEQLKQIKKKK